MRRQKAAVVIQASWRGHCGRGKARRVASAGSTRPTSSALGGKQGTAAGTAAQVQELTRGLAEERQKRETLEQALKMLWTEVKVRAAS